jgi:hypothetical protein
VAITTSPSSARALLFAIDARKLKQRSGEGNALPALFV